MKEIPAAYRVEIDPDAQFPVDPQTFDPTETTLVRVRDGLFLLRWRGRSIPLHIERDSNHNVRMWTGHQSFDAVVLNHRDQLLAAWGYDAGSADANPELTAPMPGLVLSVSVKAGDDVEAGDPLLVLEAMKMENELRAESATHVTAVRVEAGEAVSKGQVLVEFAS